MDSPTLSALALVTTLKPSPADSSSDLMAAQLLNALSQHGVSGDTVRIADHDVKPGVQTDMGDGDEWPSIRDKVLAADILVLCTPTWAGHPSSLTQRVIERLDAELSETDDAGRPILFGKVAIVGVVGNEDGAHAIIADVIQALNDFGYTIPAQGSTYWNGEAMHKTDYKDLTTTPDATAAATSTAATNAVHLARSLKRENYPVPSS